MLLALEIRNIFGYRSDGFRCRPMFDKRKVAARLYVSSSLYSWQRFLFSVMVVWRWWLSILI